MRLKQAFALVMAFILVAFLAFGWPEASDDSMITVVPQEMTMTEIEALGLFPTDWVVFVSGPGYVLVEAGEGPVTFTFTVENGGENADNYALSAWSREGLGFADLSGLPPEIALAPGESREVTIEVTVPAGTAFGLEETFYVRAASTLSGLSSPDSGRATVWVVSELGAVGRSGRR